MYQTAENRTLKRCFIKKLTSKLFGPLYLLLSIIQYKCILVLSVKIICLANFNRKICIFVCIPPHGVCDTHRGTEEGGEAEESDEDGGHLAHSVRPPGGLTVHHHAALWGENNTCGGHRSRLPSQI